MNKPLIEACVDSYASCMAAAKGGADRLELCAHLAIGGTTPSPVVFKQVQRDCDVKINVPHPPPFRRLPLYGHRDGGDVRGDQDLP